MLVECSSHLLLRYFMESHKILIFIVSERSQNMYENHINYIKSIEPNIFDSFHSYFGAIFKDLL